MYPTFYITLVRELSGCCLMAVAPNEGMVRAYAAKYLGKMWCSVYDIKPRERVIGQTIYLEEGEDI